MVKLRKFRQRIIEAMGQCHGSSAATIDHNGIDSSSPSNAALNSSNSGNQSPRPQILPRRGSASSADSRKKKSKSKGLKLMGNHNNVASSSTMVGNPTSPNVSMHSQHLIPVGAPATGLAVVQDGSNHASERSSFSNVDILASCIDPFDVVVGIEERLEYMINQMSPAELLQVQRRLRKIARSVRKKEGTGVGRNAMIINASKSALSRGYLDDYVFKRLFSGSAESMSKCLEEWQKMKKRQWAAQQQATKQGLALGSQGAFVPPAPGASVTSAVPAAANGNGAMDNLDIPTLEEEGEQENGDVLKDEKGENLFSREDSEVIRNEVATGTSTSEINKGMGEATFDGGSSTSAIGDDVDSTSTASASQLSRSQHSFTNIPAIEEEGHPPTSAPLQHSTATAQGMMPISPRPPPSPSRPSITTLSSHSLVSNPSSLLSGGSSRALKIDPLMSLYLLLLYSGETWWDSFAAHASWLASNKDLLQHLVTATSRGSAVGQSGLLASPTVGGGGGSKRKNLVRGLLTSGTGSMIANGGSSKGKDLNDDEDGSPHGGGQQNAPGITFLMLSFLISMALRGNLRQKLLVLFHACIPHKQIKLLLQQQSSQNNSTSILSNFPSYLFETGFADMEENTWDTPWLSADSPTRNVELCGLEVSRSVAADVIASLLLSIPQDSSSSSTSNTTPAAGGGGSLPQLSETLSVPSLALPFSLNSISNDNIKDGGNHHNPASSSGSHSNTILKSPYLTKLYNSCCGEPKMFKFHEFVQWLSEDIGLLSGNGATSGGVEVGQPEEGGDAILNQMMQVLLLNDVVLSSEGERQMMEALWSNWVEEFNDLPAANLSHGPSSLINNNSKAGENVTTDSTVLGEQQNEEESNHAVPLPTEAINPGASENDVVVEKDDGLAKVDETTGELLSKSNGAPTTPSTATASSTTLVPPTASKHQHVKKKSGLWGFVSGGGGSSSGGGGSSSSVMMSPTMSAFSSSSFSRKANNGHHKAISGIQHGRVRPFGGIGTYDGKGGLNGGILYCVNKKWWDQWVIYTKWGTQSDSNVSIHENKSLGSTTFDEGSSTKLNPITSSKVRRRPPPLSNETLLLRPVEDSGLNGSFERMKSDLRQNEDYVLVPPPVWDALFQLYGGGPPLPRMVVQYDHDHHQRGTRTTTGATPLLSSPSSKNVPAVDVVLDPWVISCQVCDPLQPYRRGDAGPMSIRCMVTPEQPFWRLLAELVCRSPITNPRAREASTGKGQGRLWRRIDNTTTGGVDGNGTTTSSSNRELTGGSSRFGPWTLLCKGRCFEFPVTMLPQSSGAGDFDWSFFEEAWINYVGANASVESFGLNDGDCIMFEYAIIGKDSNITWPREAAAKAGRMRRLAEEDAAFRLMLRGLDKDGNPSKNVLSSLQGASIDAMDSTGRWYRSKIAQVETRHVQRKVKKTTTTTADNPGHDGDSSTTLTNGGYSPTNGVSPPGKSNDNSSVVVVTMTEVVLVKVDFCDVAYHEEWIEVDSDRLAVEGRYTLDSMKSLQKMESDSDTNNGGASATVGAANGDSVTTSTNKTASTYALGRKVSSGVAEVTTMDNSTSGGSICSFPGYGACGLLNLGNSCYMNVALECVSYMPFVRSYLLSSQYKNNGDLNRENPLGSGGRILEELGELMRLMWTGKYGARSPTKFRSTLGKIRTQFSGTEQQDAQELLNAVFDALHEDSNKVRKKPMVPPIDDDWAKTMELPRVGLEAWRRFLRRNRSIIANTAMGQVLNRVTCPVCKHSSMNFDPFNMLSIPFPTVSEVWFRCTVIRRASAYNCPSILDRKQRDTTTNSNYHNELRESSSRESTIAAPAPSEKNVAESFVLSVSRLADIGDLKIGIEEKSGISADRLRLCKYERVPIPSGFRSKISESNRYMKLIPLSDKEGPCVQLTKTLGKEIGELTVTDLIVYESTLRRRATEEVADEEEEVTNAASPSADDDDRTVSSEDDLTADKIDLGVNGKRSRVRDHLRCYGSPDECIVVDTDPSFLARAVSRCLWPREINEFRLGLRVDAMDQRDHWFPGSIVEISDFNPAENEANHATSSDGAGSRKVRVHFDNFSARWDEWYDFEDFENGLVRPLYSHSTPKVKPTEVLVHHRMGSSSRKGSSTTTASNGTGGEVSSALFGQPFYIQFFNEWSTARAGAHVLAQASRFLQTSSPLAVSEHGSIGSDKLDDACATISEAIDVLVSSERSYIEHAFDQQRLLDAAAITSALSEKLGNLLPKLPFDVRVCSLDSISTDGMRDDAEETSFPFSLVRTVGNYLHSKNAIILHWRHVKLDKRSKRSHTSSSSQETVNMSSTVYGEPEVIEHHDNLKLLSKGQKSPFSNGGGGAGGKQIEGKSQHSSSSAMDIGTCLTEFCKEQKLSIDDCWMCPKCKDLRAGQQSMSLWRLPDILTFHIKRFNCSARWREKISTRINFPLTGLDLSPWCEEKSAAIGEKGATASESTIYDLIGVVNHLGGMTGGHYVSVCKATPCGPDGFEEVVHTFNGRGCNIDPTSSDGGGSDEQGNAPWRLPGVRGGSKDNVYNSHPSKTAAYFAGKAMSESSEPLWLQFDDDLVEPIPPKAVVSEMAYVLFYRRRHLTTCNMARYSTLD